ncbi:hypothetical protein CGX12_11840 [Zobellella denitrificans]|uniref:hypothetical protein n=1 Tax=Zobellella denitrificans TaxID=347534 RepID=UPI000B8BF81D|nr:hypothetical protein [Zobellella denitrificans]OXS14905.1 hypothetical protein CGX12_11840 [Zobellella denitrificans]
MSERKLNATDHLRAHWRQAKADFWRHWQECFELPAARRPGRNSARDRLILDLGTIRSLYWQALGLNALPIARAIGAWWRKTAPVHRLGEVVL